MPILLLALLPEPPKFTGESAGANEAQRETNADVLRAVFHLVLTPLQQVTQGGTVMDCADGKTRLCFPILSAWITDHAEHAALQGIGSKSCPKCKVPCEELGGDPRRMYETRDYMLYREKTLKHEPAEAAGIAEYFQQLGVKIENNVFTGLNRVSPADLSKPDLLHHIYLGLFKHMMEWVEGFLTKHKRQRAFDDAGKEIPPYPGFSVQKKADHEITQWQGKDMRNLGRCISAVLASALRNPHSSQYQDFKSALKCISALVDFTLMAQDRSHRPDTLSYMESYLQTFHRTKDILLECRTSKATRAQANRQDRELRELMADQRGKEVCHRTISNRRRLADQERVARSDRQADLIRRENHFNFIKMHYLTHFASHVRRFGCISMYSTEIGDLAYRD